MVFPVHNESFIIEQTLRNYIAELEDRVSDLEIIVAEDGSTDDTKVVLERIQKELSIRLFLGDERKGYQRAVIDACAHATKPWLFIVDSDYQFAAPVHPERRRQRQRHAGGCTGRRARPRYVGRRADHSLRGKSCPVAPVHR